MSKDLWEEEAIKRFRSYLSQARSCSFIITGRDVIVDPISRENFDYKLTSSTGQTLAVEIVRLVESKEELVSSKIWSQVVDELKKELIKRGISGYVISLPLHLNIPRREIRQYVNQAADIINQSIVTHQGIDQFSSNQMKFYRLPDYEGVSFASTPEARSINPHGTAASALLMKLEKKNRQLSIQEHERILLVVNWAIIVDETDMVRALTTIPFEAYPNIDTIYFETRSSQFSYVYDRAVYSSILNNDHTGSLHSELLSHYLKYRLADGKRDAFTFVRTRTECLGSITWLHDELARQNLITYVVDGGETTEEEQLWVIRTLCADPDPDPEGKNSLDDPEGEHNYHLSMLKEEDHTVITGVRGHLCRLMAKLICRNQPQYYDELLDIIEKYLSESNLYTRTQAMVPLADFAARLMATRNEDGSSFNWSTESRKRVSPLAFRALHDNVDYPRVLQHLLHVFQYLRMLNEAEASLALESFLKCKRDYIDHDLAPLLMYYALFRSHNGMFDPQHMTSLLREQIVSGSPSMRESLAWHFWKCLDSKEVTVDEVKPYLLLFWDGSYDQRLASMFDMIWEILLDAVPALACELFVMMAEKLKQFTEERPNLHGEVWTTKAEELVGALAQNAPENLLNVVEILVSACKKGAFIHDLPGVLESYRYIDGVHRQTTKSNFQLLYKDIKVLNQKFPDVNWSIS